MSRAVLVVVLVVAAVGLGWLGLRFGAGMAQPPVLGVQDDGQLAACPDADNCVSSRGIDPRHAIEPLPCPETSVDDIARVADDRLARTTLETVDDGYAHLTARGRWVGFVDDIELQADGDVVHVRSAARLGGRDFRTNRDRLETLRAELAAAGLCR